MARLCDLCCCHIDDTRNRQNVATSECAMAVLDGLITNSSLGLSRVKLVPSGHVCRKCYLGLEKLKKAQATVDQLTASFLGYLRSRVANEEDLRQNTLQSTMR